MPPQHALPHPPDTLRTDASLAGQFRLNARFLHELLHEEDVVEVDLPSETRLAM